MVFPRAKTVTLDEVVVAGYYLFALCAYGFELGLTPIVCVAF